MYGSGSTGGAGVALMAMAALVFAGCTAAPAQAPQAAPLAQGQRFYMQLSGTPEVPDGAQIVILDGADTPASTVRALQDSGVQVLCYFNAGGFEDWRSDAVRFPASTIGEPLDDWPGESWLDIREVEVLEPIMAARMDQCADKGFDGVDPDNIDGYDAETGFGLTEADALGYMQVLARLAHERGLLVGLKNAVELLAELASTVDFAVNEECLAYRECEAYQVLVDLGRPVLHIEYSMPLGQACDSPPGFSSMVSDLDVGPGGQMCPA
ncbi:MAG: endo alpha-1,4 polygalactosaminidase [Beutenbergiaceae bacterium]